LTREGCASPLTLPPLTRRGDERYELVIPEIELAMPPVEAFTDVKKGQVMAQITVDIGGGNKIMSAIFSKSAEDLSLEKSDKVMAVIESTDVIIFKRLT
jgi:molybdopterin-binding protein